MALQCRLVFLVRSLFLSLSLSLSLSLPSSLSPSLSSGRALRRLRSDSNELPSLILLLGRLGVQPDGTLDSVYSEYWR